MAINLGTLEYLISVNDSKLNKGIKDSEKSIKQFGNKLSAWTVAKGQMIAKLAESAARAATNVIKTTVKGAVEAFADFEQLEGGVKKLFGSDFRRVMNNAAQAYKTAGISANEYMQTVTEFSAALISGLGGDTAKAADIADQALIDMADNANTFGSSMESIQNAYRGFSKQNYTMLDNLKLGYGGTKSEMERLLKDAEKLTGVKYNIKNLSDVYEAIHAIQVELKIAGTTKKEAENTISGSINSAKAAWKDLLVAIGSGKDLKKATGNFTKSAKNVIKNIRPVALNAIKNIFKVAKDLMPELKKIIKESLNAIRISVADWIGLDNNAKWGDIARKIWEKIKAGIKKLPSMIGSLLGLENANWSQIAGKIGEKIAEKVEQFGQFLVSLADWIGKNPDKIVKVITSLADAIAKAAGPVAEALGKILSSPEFWSSIGDAITAITDAIGNEIMYALGLKERPKDLKGKILIKEAAKPGQRHLHGSDEAEADIPYIVESRKFYKEHPEATIYDEELDTFISSFAAYEKQFKTILKNRGFTDKAISQLWQEAQGSDEDFAKVLTDISHASFEVTEEMEDLQDVYISVEEAAKKTSEAQSKNADAVNSATQAVGSFEKKLDSFETPSKGTQPVASYFIPQGGDNSNSNPHKGTGILLPGKAKGDWRVPYDMPALLHRDETVLNKSQARRYREGSETDYGMIGSLVANAVDRAMSKVYVMMSGEKVGDLTTKRVKRNINVSSYNKLRAMGG